VAIMTEIYSSGPALPPIPDDLTVAQFMLDYHHSARPVRAGVPCLIEDGTGRPIGFDEVSIDLLATLSGTFDIETPVVGGLCDSRTFVNCLYVSSGRAPLV